MKTNLGQQQIPKKKQLCQKQKEMVDYVYTHVCIQGDGHHLIFYFTYFIDHIKSNCIIQNTKLNCRYWSLQKIKPKIFMFEYSAHIVCPTPTPMYGVDSGYMRVEMKKKENVKRRVWMKYSIMKYNRNLCAVHTHWNV